MAAILIEGEGRIFRDADGKCAMELPKPDPELEEAFRRFAEKHCFEFLASASFVDELRGHDAVFQELEPGSEGAAVGVFWWMSSVGWFGLMIGKVTSVPT